MIKLSKMPPPPQGNGNHPACNTPNPPPWCSDTPRVEVDMFIGLGILIALIIGLSITIKRKRK